MQKFSDLRILIVDDMTTIRNVCKKVFTKLGANNLSEADSLDSAWRLIVEAQDSGEPFDVIFCDWNMPGGNGNELLEKIRSHKDNDIRLLNFIMVTGAHENTILAMDAGANNVIHKPFTTETIIKKFELLFGIMEAA